MTGRPGHMLCHPRSGATNASTGIHIAHQDSSPLIMFVGQVGARHARARGVSGSRLPRLVRLHDQMDDRDRRSRARAEIVSRAFYMAANGRPGPVVIAIPEDMLVERVAVPDAPPFAPVETSPGPDEMAEFAAMLVGSERADHAARRQPLVAGGVGRRRTLRAEIFAAGRDHLPPRPSVRPAAPLLCRRSRHRAESEAAGARQGAPISSSWSAAGSANCHRRVTRCSTFRAAGDLRARPSGRRRTRPRLQPASRDPRDADGLRCGAGQLNLPRRAARRGEGRPCRLSRIHREADRTARRGQFRRGHGVAARQPSRRRHHLQRRRQFRGLDSSLLSLAPFRPACRADLGLDGLWRSGRGRHEAALSGPHRSCASPATAIS